MDTEKTYSFSFTPDNPEKLEQLFDSLRRNASVVEIKTESGTEEPDRIIFNGSSYSKRNECKRIPDFLRVSGFYFSGREAISFNEDGFIGIAGWADDTNVQPFLRAFHKWVCEWMIGVTYR